MLFACSELSLGALPPEITGLPEAQNPYELPSIDNPDIVLVTTNWYRWLEATHGDEVERVFSRLRQSAGAVVGCEEWDTFDLGLPPAAFDHVDLVIKTQGLYTDRERYNLRGGAVYPRTAAGPEPLPTGARYTMSQLDKLRLSVPCFLGVDRRVRARVRRAKPDIPVRSTWVRQVGDVLLEGAVGAQAQVQRPKKLAHFVGSLSHISRLDLVRTLQQIGASGDHRITAVPSRVFGSEYRSKRVPSSVRTAWREELRQDNLLGAARGRASFRRSMPAHKIVLAPFGFGELTFRHAEAWASGRALVCPNMTYAETMYPFRNGHNVLFCSPDWADLPQIVSDLNGDEQLWRSIGSAGRRDWRAWSAGYEQILRAGIVDHLREALGMPSTVTQGR
jgi:hypothetical protein